MNQRFISVLVFAFVVAAGASLLLYRLMSNRETTKAAPVTTIVLVAARNLEPGTVLHEGDVKVGEWSGTPPAGAVTKKEEAIGRGVISAIYASEPVLDSRLAPKGAGGGLAAMIPAGMRAVAVRVNEVVGVAGFVVPGMHVDVLISGNPGTGANVTKTLLQNIEVLSAGQDFKKDNEGKPVLVQVVNLLVTPTQAEMLSLASNQTQIQLVLRNPLDKEVAQTPGSALAALFGGVAKPAAASSGRSAPRTPPLRSSGPEPVRLRAPEAPTTASLAQEPKKAPFVMEMINGNKRSESRFSVPAEEH